MPYQFKQRERKIVQDAIQDVRQAEAILADTKKNLGRVVQAIVAAHDLPVECALTEDFSGLLFKEEMTHGAEPTSIGRPADIDAHPQAVQGGGDAGGSSESGGTDPAEPFPG